MDNSVLPVMIFQWLITSRNMQSLEGGERGGGACQCVLCGYSFQALLQGRKKEASKVKQTARQSNTAHPRQSLFLRKLPRVGLEPTKVYTLDRALYQLSYQGSSATWLGPNLTSHSTPGEQAYYQLSMKEKAGIMKPPKTPNTKPNIYMF